MKMDFFTIAYNAMPFIAWHVDVFRELEGVDWRWTIAEGAAMNVKDTHWCRKIEPGLSTDGTKEYLDWLAATEPRVSVIHDKSWHGKTAQVNACLKGRGDYAVLVQIDADEIWSAAQLRTIGEVFEADQKLKVMKFACNYFFGPSIVAVEHEAPGRPWPDWIRAWRYKGGLRFITHEPPNLAGNFGPSLNPGETHKLGLMFNHYSYATEAQVAFKERYYGQDRAVECWKRLQDNHKWPLRNVNKFLYWCGPHTGADLFNGESSNEEFDAIVACGAKAKEEMARAAHP